MAEEQLPGEEQETLLDGHESLMAIFDELSFSEKFKKVMYGLKQPKESGAHKYARLQIIRLSAPAAAVVVPCLIILILVTLSVFTPPPRSVEMIIVDPEKLEDLEDIEELEEEIEPIEMEIDYPDDAPITEFDDSPPAPVADFSPVPAEFDSVAIIKSPMIMKGIMGSRNPGSRGRARAMHGGSKSTERSVLLALRWLKKYQESDGSWHGKAGGGEESGTATTAMTGLSLLTFLAHGEIPGQSPEFGATVQNGIKWLIENQKDDGHFNHVDSNEYSHPIAAYALCETYALTKIPMVKVAAEKAMDVVIKGQNPRDLLWNYSFNSMKRGQSERNDISFAGWCIQALKAADMAGLDNEGLKPAIHKAIQGLKKNYRATPSAGGFCYTTGDVAGPLTCVGVLCGQLLGVGKSNEIRKGLMWLEANATCDWDEPWPNSPIYYWYYTTQAMFHAGGKTWNNWNRQASKSLVINQTIVKNAINDLNGELVDIGYWEPAADSEHCKSYTYNTTLCALMLQVYYRYLPTYKKPEVLAEEITLEDEDTDIDIEIL